MAPRNEQVPSSVAPPSTRPWAPSVRVPPRLHRRPDRSRFFCELVHHSATECVSMRPKLITASTALLRTRRLQSRTKRGRLPCKCAAVASAADCALPSSFATAVPRPNPVPSAAALLRVRFDSVHDCSMRQRCVHGWQLQDHSFKAAALLDSYVKHFRQDLIQCLVFQLLRGFRAEFPQGQRPTAYGTGRKACTRSCAGEQHINKRHLNTKGERQHTVQTLHQNNISCVS